MVKRKIQKIFGFSCFKASEDMISSSLPSMGGERDKGGGGEGGWWRRVEGRGV